MPVDPRRAVPNPFQDAVDHVLSHQRTTADSRRKAERAIRAFAQWWNAHTTDGPFRALTAEHAKTYRDHLLYRHTAADVRYHLSTLKAVWDVLLARGHTSTNPFGSRMCPRPKLPPRQERPAVPELTFSELQRAFVLAEREMTMAGIRDALLIALLYLWPDRPFDELAKLRREHLGNYFSADGSITIGSRSWDLPLRLTNWLRGMAEQRALFPPVDRSGRMVVDPLVPADKSRLYVALKKRGRQAGHAHPLTPTRIRQTIPDPPSPA